LNAIFATQAASHALPNCEQGHGSRPRPTRLHDATVEHHQPVAQRSKIAREGLCDRARASAQLL
jgi:hypothetical protein